MPPRAAMANTLRATGRFALPVDAAEPGESWRLTSPADGNRRGGRAFSEAKAAGGQTMKRIMMASALLGSVVLGAPAFANDTYSGTDTTGSSTSMTNPHAVHKKLMKDCMDQQKAQGGSSASDARKACESKVKDQMQQM